VEDCNKEVDIQGLWTFKIGGYKIQVHANDVDPWPSNPHGHIYDKNLVIDKNGNIFKAHLQFSGHARWNFAYAL